MGLFGGYEWDAQKARAALTMPDEITAVDEQRFLTMGRDSMARVLVVAYTWRGGRIRVFSARPATPAERRRYRERHR